MTNPFRIVVLAALTVFAVSSFPTTGSAAKVRSIPCADSQDCPIGDRCKITHTTGSGEGTGICVRASKLVKKKHH
jgi:hypothetical protein